jgi:hypothetical protein
MITTPQIKTPGPLTGTLKQYQDHQNQIKKQRLADKEILHLFDDEQQPKTTYPTPQIMLYSDHNTRRATLVALALLIAAFLTGLLGIFLVLNPDASGLLWK